MQEYWFVLYRMWGADGPTYAWFRSKENATKFYNNTDFSNPPEKCRVSKENWLEIKRIESLLED